MSSPWSMSVANMYRLCGLFDQYFAPPLARNQFSTFGEAGSSYSSTNAPVR